jgi:hypothetical protein
MLLEPLELTSMTLTGKKNGRQTIPNLGFAWI